MVSTFESASCYRETGCWIESFTCPTSTACDADSLLPAQEQVSLNRVGVQRTTWHVAVVTKKHISVATINQANCLHVRLNYIALSRRLSFALASWLTWTPTLKTLVFIYQQVGALFAHKWVIRNLYILKIRVGLMNMLLRFLSYAHMFRYSWTGQNQPMVESTLYIYTFQHQMVMGQTFAHNHDLVDIFKNFSA